MPVDSLYQDTILQEDTVFGINNEMSIPVRQTLTESATTSKPIEKLFDPVPKVVEVANWQVLLLLLSVVFVGLVKSFSSSRFKQGIKALFNYTVAQEITRDAFLEYL